MSILKPVRVLAIIVVAMAANNTFAIDPPIRVGSVREPQNPAPPPPPQRGNDSLNLNAAARQGTKAAPETRDKAGEQSVSKAGAKINRKKTVQTSPQQLVKRRSVHQMIDPVPRVQSPMVYGPVLTGPRPVGVRPLPMPMPMPAPASPQILNGCNGGACTDPGGTRYHGGVGNVLISPDGRACSNNGITVQCF